MSQADAILNAFEQGRVLSRRDMRILCGSEAGNSRVAELREDGKYIRCERIKVNGKPVYVYWMPVYTGFEDAATAAERYTQPQLMAA